MGDGPKIISSECARRIWLAHREIEVAKKLLNDIEIAHKNGDDPTPLDAFGRRRAFTFGVPMGNDGHRLLDVSPFLAVRVLETHIADKQRELAEASQAALIEATTPSALGSPVATPPQAQEVMVSKEPSSKPQSVE